MAGDARAEVRMSESAMAQAVREHAVSMAALLVDFNLHPERGLHVSWMPGSWPPGLRSLAGCGQAGHAVAATWLGNAHRLDGPFDASFVSTRKRLALLDGRALRLVGWYCGVALHAPLMLHAQISRPLRRQIRRFGPDADHYATRRLPSLTAARVRIDDPGRGQGVGVGRRVWWRGMRLLLALIALEGPDTLRRVQLKLPRRWASTALPSLTSVQARQIEELIVLSIVPERIPSWDWLF